MGGERVNVMKERADAFLKLTAELADMVGLTCFFQRPAGLPAEGG